MNNIGIMQGRLSPSQGDRLQFFPKDWVKEFQLAQGLGFSCIEWVVDWHKFWENPVFYLSDTEVSFCPIREMAENSGVSIVSACFDYLMKYTLFERDQNHLRASSVLELAIPKLAKMGVKIITIAFVEDVAIKTQDEKTQIRKALNLSRVQLEKYNMSIAIETEMDGEELKDYIDSFDNYRIGVCYDTGNCITMGHDLAGDIRILGSRIQEVHLKDRKIGSRESICLGSGDVDFDDCFSAFKSINFNGPYILQAWRGEHYIANAKRQLDFVKTFVI